MGDMSHEPSMEEILSSIKKIIADDGSKSGMMAKAKRIKIAGTDDAEGSSASESDILELTDNLAEESVPEAAHSAAPTEPVHFVPAEVPPAPVASAPIESAQAAMQTAPESMISAQSAAASRAALARLADAQPREAPTQPDMPLGEFVGDLLRPMLKDWLDANLPALVERMVAKEIARLRD
ncbi:MAG: DUF2497 domain-containing protein [Alphaproteobacteria bacterium]|nr:DUF2497 domain-containing protein [Alphaproteobacteria bacterium]MDE2041806.1 DUF2497 domain-containing protein [Alphaproteobacteria bacterium]MDE2340870.1 DUF2497 domain-containing protein [Alphaproteobacteria bacterium]